MFLAARTSPLLMQRMHGGYIWICCEIGSRASETARIMTEWSCIDEREWMEHRTKGKEQGAKAKGGQEEEAAKQTIFKDLAGYGVRRTIQG